MSARRAVFLLLLCRSFCLSVRLYVVAVVVVLAVVVGVLVVVVLLLSFRPPASRSVFPSIPLSLLLILTLAHTRYLKVRSREERFKPLITMPDGKEKNERTSEHKMVENTHTSSPLCILVVLVVLPFLLSCCFFAHERAGLF